jgi:hypothetical protein
MADLPDYSEARWTCVCGQECIGIYLTGTVPDFTCSKCGKKYEAPTEVQAP